MLRMAKDSYTLKCGGKLLRDDGSRQWCGWGNFSRGVFCAWFQMPTPSVHLFQVSDRVLRWGKLSKVPMSQQPALQPSDTLWGVLTAACATGKNCLNHWPACRQAGLPDCTEWCWNKFQLRFIEYVQSSDSYRKFFYLLLLIHGLTSGTTRFFIRTLCITRKRTLRHDRTQQDAGDQFYFFIL